MKKIFNLLNRSNTRRNRLLLVMAVLTSFLALTFGLQSPAPNTDVASYAAEPGINSASTNDAAHEKDIDGDGVLGPLDACPDAAGAAIDNGCPIDSDGDGIKDLSDLCPTQSGDVDGCPSDSDKDGVIDDEDSCLHNAGSVANQGCPSDSDGDGIGDAIDQCPQTAGQISLNGCAPKSGSTDASEDTQKLNNQANDAYATGSKLANCTEVSSGEQSDCPAAAGENSNNSGPPQRATETIGADTAMVNSMANQHTDTDGDGKVDIEDRCPDVAGQAAAAGCLPREHDSQFTLDAEDQRVLDEALAKVAFDSNSATLKPESRDFLAAVAALLRKYPAASLEIRGHTDASGIADNNMRLSMARARSAAAYIVAAGTDVNRIKAFGFGESQPIANNHTPDGRKTNRRVEFDLYFDK